VETTVLPFKSGSVLRFADFLAPSGWRVTKWVMVNTPVPAAQVVRRRAAFEVDRAVRHQRDAFAEGHELVLDVELGHLELGLHRVDDPQAQLDRVADRLLLVVVVRERIEASRGRW